MTQAGFATAGYLIFWNFNRIELLSAALLTGVLVISNNLRSANNWRRSAIALSVLLLAISLVDTYFLTQMCAAPARSVRAVCSGFLPQ